MTVAIAAKDRVWQHYASGIITECEDIYSDIDHYVFLVGYGTSNDGTDYWLIVNTWGSDWGDGGTAKLARVSDEPYGTCGILKHVLVFDLETRK